MAAPSFVGAKQKALAYQNQFGGSPSADRPSADTGKYRSGTEGIKHVIPSSFQMPSTSDNSAAIQQRTGSSLNSLMTSGLQNSTQQFSQLSALGHQSRSAINSLHQQGQMNEEQLKRAKLGQPSGLSTALGFVNQGLSLAGGLGSFGGGGGGSATGGSSTPFSFYGPSNPVSYSSGFNYFG